MTSFDSNLNPKRRTLIGAAAAVALGATAALAASQTPPRVIRVVARKFVFEPRRIAVKKGEAVVLEFTAPEVVMGFNLAAFGLRTDILPGQVARLSFKADKAGEFPFFCDVFCGSGHEEMDGMLVVTD